MSGDGTIDPRDDVPQGDSLAARMGQRAEVLALQTTERFPIPGYEGVLEVELRALGYKTISRVQHRNEKERDEGLREIYNLADQLVAATVGFYDVGGLTPDEPLDDDWVRLAKRMPKCPDAPTPRQALLFLVTDKRIHFLVDDWGRWAKAAKTEADEEIDADFVATG